MYNPTDFNPLALDNEFIENYRTRLKEGYDAGVAALDNQRQIDQTAIMTNANKAGMLYSNIPERMKIQYDTQTYMPAQVSLRNTYQTSLDKIRENAVNAANQVAYYQQMINHYNSLPTTTSNSGTTLDAIAQLLGNGLTSGNSATSGMPITPTQAATNLLDVATATAQKINQ